MVVHAYFPLGEPRVQREARALVEAGYSVEVFCLRHEDEPFREERDGVRIRRMRLSHRRGAGLARALVEYLAFLAGVTVWLTARAAWKPFDVVQFHNPPDFLVFSGLLPKLRGVRLILDVHDLSPHMFKVRAKGAGADVFARVLTYVERCACWFVHRVITVHRPYRDELIADGVPADKIDIVMNSVDPALLRGVPRRMAARRPTEDFTVAYHGTLTWWYGTDLIVDAVSALDEDGRTVRAVLLGDGDAVPLVRERAAKLGLGDRVAVSGRYLPIEEALAQVATADCGVIPNRPTEINRYALSSKLFEYIELEVPVVVARLETLAAHFSEDEVTFFEPGDADSLAAGLRWVMDQPDAARGKARRAKVRARDYSWEHGRARLRQIYAELLAAGGGVGQGAA